MTTKDRKRRPRRTGALQLEKTGFYTMRICINGNRVAKTTGTKDREEALRMLDAFVAPFIHRDRIEAIRKLELLVADENQRAQMEEDARPQLRVSDSWCHYVKSCRRKTVAEETLMAKRGVWEHFANWTKIVYGPGTELRSVTPEMAEAYLRCLRRDYAATTWNNKFCQLREIYRILMKPAMATANPFDGFPLLPEDCHSRRAMTLEELELLIREASKLGYEWRTLFLIGIHTGLRLGDCCRLKWEQVDLSREIIQLIPSKTRTRTKDKIVTIPIHSQLLSAFSVVPNELRAEYVLPGIAATHISAKHRISYQLEKIFAAAGIETNERVEGRRCKVPVATFHSLRHTFVSITANAGVPLHVIQSIVGHESRAMTWHYYHEDEAALRNAVSAIPAIGISAGKEDAE